jgi:hypothetical protein
MSDLFAQAKAYYESAASDPWRWAEDASVLVWADGTTVAFREEVSEILDGLAPAGLPPFRLVVLILAACKGKFPTSSEHGPVLRERIRPSQLELPPPIAGEQKADLAGVWNDPANQEFSEFIARLRVLHQLPPEQRESPRVKAVLIETILEELSVSRVQPAREIAAALRDLPLRELNSPETRVLQESIRAYRLLHAGLKNFSALSFALRLRTGLDALPAPAQVELRPSERARQLLAALRSDPEHQGLAKVTRDIMAAIYMPRALSELDELALGGFSDIANRGSLDRLLPSELANDDLTLATRIALNEALYIRREPPSNHPPSQLAMLLDVGVRQWGLPRIFATAVALAFIAREERCTDVAVWRAGRNTLQKADLLSRNGLVEHLGVLDTYAHPGATLKPFFAQFAQLPEMEAVLVTHRDCLGDPDFQRQLAEIDWKRFYIATVERDGSFELFAHPNRQKPLCQAEIALEELFTERPEAAAKTEPKLKERKRDATLPLILKVKPFPFLLPVLGKIQWSCQLANEAGLAVVADRRLVRWDSPVKGAYTLVEKVPPGKTIWLGATEQGKRVHVLKILTNTGMASLTSWNVETNETVTTELRFWKHVPLAAYERNGVLYIISKTEASAWEVEAGRFLGKLELPVGHLLADSRYLGFGDGESRFLGYDSTGLGFLRFTHPPKWKDLSIIALFDRERFENNPFALTADGKVYASDGECIINLGLVKAGDRVGFRRFSRDGHRILLNGYKDQEFYLIDLWRRSARRLPAPPGTSPPGVLEPIIAPPGRTVRVKFTHISSAPGEELMLRSTKGVWYKITLESKALHLRRVPNGAPEPPAPVSFEPVHIPTEYNFRLKVASWPDGSKAWLDSRGLLHLKRGNSSNPEVSLVLTDGPLAAWSSDGRICGPDYFLHKPALDEAATLMTRIELFCPIA